MAIDLNGLSEELARDPDVTDYDFWRAIKTLDNEIFRLTATDAPLPIDILRRREILRRARRKREKRNG